MRSLRIAVESDHASEGPGMQRQRILIVEDDEAIREGVKDALSFQGFETLEAGHGELGCDMALSIDCDLVLLDMVLPGMDGMDILASIRERRPTLPIIILTARGSEEDRIRGLELGADDYVVKPFSVRELLARISAVLRRSPGRPSDIQSIELDAACIDLERCEVRFQDGHRAELSEREIELLRYLARHPGRAMSRQELLSNVWRIDPQGVSTRTIDMHVARLREKLRDKAEQKILLTVRGKGYMLVHKHLSVD